MVLTAKIDDRRFRKALSALAKHSKRDGQTLLKQRARIFVREVVRITPPNQGGGLSAAPGRRSVASDIRKILRPGKKNAVDPVAIHRRYRTKNGRVLRDLRKGKDTRHRAAGLAAYIRSEQAKVGILASGWVAAARELGVRLPNWITRHGAKRGSYKLKISPTSLVITITNRVGFASNVTRFESRVNWVLARGAERMERMVADYLIKGAARKSGFTVR